MKTIKADLLASVGGSYDQTRTTIQGHVAQKTLAGRPVLGPPLVSYADVMTDAGFVPNNVSVTPNGRCFALGSEANGITPLALYNFDFNTGAFTYVGRIDVRTADVATTTTTFRGLKINDTGTTGWDIMILTTGSIVINGGLYLINNIDLADFVPVGFPTIPFATGNNQKACYFLQDPAAIGVGQLNTASVGMFRDAPNGRVYVHNGSAAVHQYYVYDYSISPTWASAAVTGDAGTDVIADAGHPYLDNDQVTFNSLTGGLGLTAGTVYFVRNSVPGVSYQLSATTGGAVINFTTNISAATLGRAFGITGSNFVHKTGNLTALSGTILSNDSEDMATPGHTTNAGFLCAFFGTTTNFYLGRLSELTSGATSWPSLVTVNNAGSIADYIAMTTVQAGWSQTLDMIVFSAANSRFFAKQMVNNQINIGYGSANFATYEATIHPTVEFGAVTINNMDLEQGWHFISSSTAGQRVIMAFDTRSDQFFDYSYVVTKVLNTQNSSYNSIHDQLIYYTRTNNIKLQYRTSGFGSITGGWTDIENLSDISAVAAFNQIQFKILFTMASRRTNPAQVYELLLSLSSLNEISDNWEYSHDDSDPGTGRVAFRLKAAYASVVPAMYFRAYDLSGTLVASHNTSANPSFFEYSTDGGVNWNPLGTVPNTVGTMLRYTFTSAPGVDVRPSIRES